MTDSSPRKFVVRIIIDKLFDQYSYDLAPKAGLDALSQLFILYGENGSGKTTILWLLDHLLSRELGEGHRTFLAKTQFKGVAVHLSDGAVISATRPRAEIGNYTLTLKQGVKRLKYEYKVDEDGDIPPDVKNDAAHEAFRRELPDLKLTVLSDDRRVSIPRAERRIFRVGHRDLRGSIVTSEDAEKDPSALQPALKALREWARSRALEGSDAGQRDVNVIYTDLLKRLARANESAEPLPAIIEKLAAQGKRSALFSRFGISSEVEVTSIIKVISESPPPRQAIMAHVIRPYLDSNNVRFDALESLQNTLATFVDELNGRFLRNKKITFDLRQGVRISSNEQMLNPSALSSGEKQLLVLFCNVAQASNRPSIFIIDEPELSLNVDWQRHLIDALQKLASENVQFIFATHSLELLARHRNAVAKLAREPASAARVSAETNGAKA